MLCETVHRVHRQAVEFIQSSIGACLQVLTTRGSLLKSLSFTVEVTHKVRGLHVIVRALAVLCMMSVSPASLSLLVCDADLIPFLPTTEL